MRNSHLAVQVLSALLLILVAGVPATLLAGETTSSIRGKVYSASGTPVSAASVEVTDQRTGISRTFATNSQGTFLASRLPVGGPYRITVLDNTLTVRSITLGDVYNLRIDIGGSEAIEEVVVYGKSSAITDIAAGPSATFSKYDLETAVAFERDISEVYGIDPRLNVDNEDDGFEINCGGKHPRFNSITLDGVSQNDRFGLNSNGYSTAVGMPFPYDAIEQVAVELAPFDVTYGGFSACNINSVTRSGSNQWEGNVFLEYTNENFRGDSIGDGRDFSTPDFNDEKWGFTLGGPAIQDKLFFFVAYEQSEKPRFLARGHDGQGRGDDRPWLSKANYDRIVSISNSIYEYDPGGSPGDGIQEDKKWMIRADWNISDNHNLAFIHNYYDGFQDRDSDGDSNEFEFANHFYVKGAEAKTSTLKVASNWTDAFSTEIFYSSNVMNDSQVTVGPADFGDFQISIGRDTIYLGADDSRQANKLNTESAYFRASVQFLLGDHVIGGGYEREDLKIFNLFVQHSRGGEYDFFDDSGNNPAFCAELTAQGRFDDPACSLSGIDKFELGRPSRIYYGSGGGTNNASDAAASFSNVANSLFLQDEIYYPGSGLTIVAGLRYDWFSSSDRPKFNQAFTDVNNGLRNDANIDGLSLLMPRVGFSWDARSDLSIRGGIGLYSGGNPNVWISNAWSNDGITNVQTQLRNFSASRSLLDGSIPISGGSPGRGIPQELIDSVAASTAADASTRRLVLIDPSYEQPREWKLALGASWDLPWWDIGADIDFLYTETRKGAMYVDLSQSVVGTTSNDIPVYAFTNGSDNLMLTNTGKKSESEMFSVVLRKDFEWGMDLMLGYAHTSAQDVVPMTSSVALSNFENLATLDINNPDPGNSNYVVPHRLTLRSSWAADLFFDLETRITLYGYASEGQAQSYVMGSQDLEGDGFYGRHLLYIPGPNDPHVVFAPGFDQNAFGAFIDREELGTGFVSRNGTHAGWSNRFDLRIDQELPTLVKGTYGKAFLKLYNVGNLLSEEWGHVTDARFFSVQVVNSSVNDNGQYVFERFNAGRYVDEVLENRSLWTLRLGLQFNF